MASKPGKEKKDTGKVIPEKESSKKESSKPKKQTEEDDDDEDIEDNDADIDTDAKPSKKGGKPAVASKKGKDDEEEEDGPEEVDEWDKVEEDENWDPDFEEFDVPKSKGKKATGGVAGKKPADDDEDFKIDDEFKDMFNDGDSFEEEDDDY